MKQTMYEKIWQAHLIDESTSLIYIDRHLVHEVTSPQAFERLRLKGRNVRRPELTLAVMDHNISTRSLSLDAAGPVSRQQLETLQRNADDNGIRLFRPGSRENGIVHVVGPEQGFTLPGTTIVCGDSHTSTHGAFGALAFGIGTSEVEHVLATQTLQVRKSRTMQVRVDGMPGAGVTAKDIILAIIARIGTNGAQGHVIEYSGQAIRDLSMEGRMTVCNMSIEAGARAGMIAPDEKTFAYLKDRPGSPKGEQWQAAIKYWRSLATDEGAQFDRTVVIEASTIEPQVSWGTNPSQVVPITGVVPVLASIEDPIQREAARLAMQYMDLKEGSQIADLPVDMVFIGSCTNSRIEDLRAAASMIKGRTVSGSVQAIVVPGSGLVKQQAESEGLDQLFIAAGFEWRMPGCSMCLAMNDDVLKPGQRAASTSNRNFEGRQGSGSRTHLVSPAMAAGAAIAGRFVDVRNF